MERSPYPPCGLGALLLATVGCSVLPSRTFPPQQVVDVEVRYRFDAMPAPRIEIPASGPSLTVLALTTQPEYGVHEEFETGRRYLRIDGVSLDLSCRLRLLGASPPPLASLFPGATSVRIAAPED